ncbi:YeeE/YedE family protein [Lysobacter terrestris]|uniref:YeeE/YedE family protein n=1 Tax=Agrilutibacter terrestris TaxID=2865112 RepID=A0A7H0G1K7_9GAMM|nr:YeeE/YedE family protein [Lysobacter terrestris]
MIGLAAVCLLGFATQRGGTCAVASIVELVSERRPGRLLALIEASVLVGGGLVLLSALGLLPIIPRGYATSAATVAGGVVLGIGAFCNRSCAIGTIARIGSGQWAYLATPIGFFLGSLAMSRMAAPEHLAGKSLVLDAPGWVAIVCILILALRLATHGWRAWRTGHGPLRYFWSPHVATSISGVAFLVVLLTVGGWTYTETLGELARGRPFDTMRASLLLVALMAGAVLGGWTVGLRPKVPTAARTGRCLVGGGLMGIGAALIPGGSDGLVFVGMPLLWPYAWLSFASMCVTIYVAVLLARPR